MKKSLFAFAFLLCIPQASFTQNKLSWHDARKAIIKKNEYIIKSYDHTVCMWTTKMAEFVLAKEFETESWNLAREVIEEIMPQLPIYQKFLENPFDDIYAQELILQSSMLAGQIAAQKNNNFEFGAKVGAIIGTYIDTLKEALRKK